jgi:hypothetical protein
MYDRQEFLEVATKVLYYNPFAKQRFSTAEDLVNFMLAFASNEIRNPGYGGTCGFYICHYKNFKGDTAYKPFMATHLIPHVPHLADC